MRASIALAAIVFVAFCAPVQDARAQGMGMGQGMGQGTGQGMGRGRRQGDKQKPDDNTIKADERAYRDALRRIPEKKSDPWGNMR